MDHHRGSMTFSDLEVLIVANGQVRGARFESSAPTISAFEQLFYIHTATCVSG